jgi:hypothetical protein
MSATQTGDTPKRRRAPKVIESMGVERDIGRIEGALKAHEDRMDRTDAAHAEQFKAFNARFDGVESRLSKQDEKLDTLILRTAKEDGASEHEKNAEESQISFWAKWSGFAIVVGTVAAVLQPAIGWLRRIIVGH